MSSSFHIYHTLLAAAAEDDKTKIQKNRPKSADQKCRVCCEKTGSIQLFNNELRTNFIGEIYSVTGVLFCYMQDLSTCICQSCVDQLDRGLRFRDMCRQSNRIIMEVNVKQEYNCNNGETQTDKKYMIKSQSIKKEENMFQENKCRSKSVKNTTTKKVKIKANDKFRDSSDNFNDEEDNSQDVFDKKYGCKVSKSPETLTKKKKIPKEPTQHLCASCGKSFTKLHDLKNHMVIHENIFPFACDKCPYKGRTKSTLVVHMKSHLARSERPLSCPHCSIKTTTASNLNAHIRRVHNNGERNFKCTRCEKDFINKGDLRRHINMVHENMGNTSCQICYKVFKKTSLRTHLWRFHKIKKEKLYSRMPAYLRCNQPEDQPEPVATQQ
ncbi:unnamed protein product [Plutella xylostella]|uniref:(diamondback moth) hypothetical protein n=1 Tax=Plutella xylostella TaxID=51655 RepID=A0A8S4G9S8_PLUXY|nr:unnamed protein product [Plutella xylostella]